jgi:hypothetical protein
MHTDGVSARFEPDGLSASTWRDPQRLADEVLRGWGRRTDDFTVLVVCPRDIAQASGCVRKAPPTATSSVEARRTRAAESRRGGRHHPFTTSSRRSGGMSYARSHSHPGR